MISSIIEYFHLKDSFVHLSLTLDILHNLDPDLDPKQTKKETRELLRKLYGIQEYREKDITGLAKDIMVGLLRI